MGSLVLALASLYPENTNQASRVQYNRNNVPAGHCLYMSRLLPSIRFHLWRFLDTDSVRSFLGLALSTSTRPIATFHVHLQENVKQSRKNRQLSNVESSLRIHEARVRCSGHRLWVWSWRSSQPNGSSRKERGSTRAWLGKKMYKTTQP